MNRLLRDLKRSSGEEEEEEEEEEEGEKRKKHKGPHSGGGKGVSASGKEATTRWEIGFRSRSLRSPFDPNLPLRKAGRRLDGPPLDARPRPQRPALQLRQDPQEQDLARQRS